MFGGSAAWQDICIGAQLFDKTSDGYTFISLPLTAAFPSPAALLVTYILALYLGSESSNTSGKQYSQLRIRQRKRNELWPNRTWLFMLPAEEQAALTSITLSTNGFK
jgi:hypothetical protein